MAHSSWSCFVSLHIFLKIEWHMNKPCSCLPSAFTFASLNRHQPELTSLTSADSKCCRLDSKWHQGVWTCHSSAGKFILPACRITYRFQNRENYFKPLKGLALKYIKDINPLCDWAFTQTGEWGYSEVLARKQSWLCVGLQSSYSKLWNSLPT